MVALWVALYPLLCLLAQRWGCSGFAPGPPPLEVRAELVLLMASCVHARSHLTLCDPSNYSLSVSSDLGISQAGVLEWLPFPPPGIFPTQGSTPDLLCLLHRRRILSLLSHGGSGGKESACDAGDPDSVPGLGRFLGEGNGNPLQCSCQENSMDRGAWWAGVSRGGKESATTERLTLPTRGFSDLQALLPSS